MRIITVVRKPYNRRLNNRVTGMDSIEILMKVEDTFGVKIPNREAEQILAVGNFHDTVWRHVSCIYSQRCKSQGLFYKLRRSVEELFDISTQQFHLNTSPNEVFPHRNRRQAYFAFAQSTNLKLPVLVLTRPWARVLNTFGLCTILGGLATSLILINFFAYSKWALLSPVLGIASTILLSKVFEPKRTLIKAPTVKAFTEQTLTLNYATLMTEEGTNRREMEMIINHIIADMAGLELEEITPEKKISDDLGID
jgi:acyl carrier protein